LRFKVENAEKGPGHQHRLIARGAGPSSRVVAFAVLVLSVPAPRFL
jgi:hypothetical protein